MSLVMLKTGLPGTNDVVIDSLPFIIGRCETAHLVILHTNVSRRHCQISFEDLQWKVNDWSSSGTYLNNVLIGKGSSRVLKEGDVIRLGAKANNLSWTFCFSYNASGGMQTTDMPVRLIDKTFQNHMDNQLAIQRRLGSNEQCTNSKEINSKFSTASIPNNVKDEEKICENPSVNILNKGNEIQMTDSSDVAQGNLSSPESVKVEKESSTMVIGTKQLREETSNQSVEEVLKELNEVKNALSDLQCKNFTLAGELAAASDEQNKAIKSKSNVLQSFTDLLETELQCTICSELFVTTVTLSCTHSFCQYCLNQWKKKQKTCPICRKKITTATRSLVLDNYIDKVLEQLSVELQERRKCIIEERVESALTPKRSRKQRQDPSSVT